MPYLGQNLDQLGVIRVKPNWDSKVDKKDKVPEIKSKKYIFLFVVENAVFKPTIGHIEITFFAMVVYQGG